MMETQVIKEGAYCASTNSSCCGSKEVSKTNKVNEVSCCGTKASTGKSSCCS